MSHEFYPITISSDTGSLDLSPGKFLADSLSPSGLLVAGITIGGGYLIGGKKHRTLGMAIGAGVMYALWSKGSIIIDSRQSK